MAPSNSNETLASSAYQRLLNDILSGKLSPCHKLRLQELKVEYKVGNSPLREALNRLSANGMVDRVENRGFRVSAVSVEELEELTRTRCWLEEIALRESINNGDEEYHESLVLTVHRLTRTPIPNQSDSSYSKEHEDLHRDFHRALIAACNSDILINYCAQMHEQTLRYRNLVEGIEDNEGHEEHKAILDAVLNRDADTAVDLLIRHYQITAEIVIASGRLSQLSAC